MRLPDWIEPLLDAERMRRVDEWAIAERRVPVLELMEAAGSALAEAVLRLAPSGPVLAVCGKGNNGGDGLVAIRQLRERGLDATALLLGEATQLSEPAAANAERLGAELTPYATGGAKRLAAADVVIDAIFGTGFSGEPRDQAGEAIDAINAAGARVVAADIPSGVDASTGAAAERSVRADLTVSFHAAKLGHWIAPGKELRGELAVADIGIPAGGPADPGAGLIGARVLGELPRRGPGSDKFAAGSVGVFGGSAGLTGAVCMAARAASRAGSGYVTCAVPASLEPIFEISLIEQMTVGCPDESGALGRGAAAAAADALARVDAAVAGPGLGREPAAQAECRELIERLDCPLVIDAQGLGALVGHLPKLAARSAPTVLTPHEGEAGRLLDRERAEVGAERLRAATDLAAASRSLVLLKGDDTIITDGERVAISSGGSPALATAGSGDVLSGVIAALLARGLDHFTAACAATVAQLEAGRQAAAALGAADGVIATDLIDRLPRALAAEEGR